jgi:hypothetical protein
VSGNPKLIGSIPARLQCLGDLATIANIVVDSDAILVTAKGLMMPLLGGNRYYVAVYNPTAFSTRRRILALGGLKTLPDVRRQQYGSTSLRQR